MYHIKIVLYILFFSALSLSCIINNTQDHECVEITEGSIKEMIMEIEELESSIVEIEVVFTGKVDEEFSSTNQLETIRQYKLCLPKIKEVRDKFQIMEACNKNEKLNPSLKLLDNHIFSLQEDLVTSCLASYQDLCVHLKRKNLNKKRNIM